MFNFLFARKSSVNVILSLSPCVKNPLATSEGRRTTVVILLILLPVLYYYYCCYFSCTEISLHWFACLYLTDTFPLYYSLGLPTYLLTIYDMLCGVYVCKKHEPIKFAKILNELFVKETHLIHSILTRETSVAEAAAAAAAITLSMLM